MKRDEIREVVTEVLAQVQTHQGPVLWTIRDAIEQTKIPRDELYRLYHAGDIKGMRFGPGGRILLKPESVIAYIDRELEQQAHQRNALVRKELAAG